MRDLSFLFIICFEFYALCFSFSQNAYALNPDQLKAVFINGDYKGYIKESEVILANKTYSRNADELYYFLGLSFLKEANPDSAGAAFKKILNDFPKSKFQQEALLGLADSYYLKGDFQRAENQYRELLNSNAAAKLKPGIYFRLSQIAARTGNRAQEIEYKEKLKNEFPASPEASENRELFPIIKAPILKPVIQNPEIQKKEISNIEFENVVMQEQEKYAAETPAVIYLIQVGAFSKRDNAKKLAAKLKAKGYTVFIAESVSRQGSIFKVRVGNFTSRQDARSAEKKLIKEGYPTKIIP